MRTLKSMFGVIVLLLGMTAGDAARSQDMVYKVDALNVGLGAPPDTLDRSSPRATMEALLDRSEEYDFTSTAHLLNLQTVPESRQSADGPALAQKLYEIIDRKVVIPWSELLDRPDALDARATSDSAVAGQARRSILVALLTIDDRPYPIYLDRLQVKEEPPVWVFSERSVENIKVLYDTYGPSEYEKMLPLWSRQDVFWNLMWWEVIGLPIMLILAGLAGVATYKACTRVATVSNRTFVTEIAEASRLSAVIFTMTLIVSVVSGVFVFSGPIAMLIAPAVALGYVLSALILVVNVIDRVIDRLVELDNDDLRQIGEGNRRATATKVSLARRMLVLAIVLIGSGIVFSEAGAFHTFGFSLLASAGVITLILGFAAREVLSNIMSSMQIALNQSARIGDKVVYDGQICNVERINFTYVLLRVWTGVRLVVPVTEFVSETFENWTIKEPEMTRLIDIRVSHTAPVDILRDAFFEVLKEVDQRELGSDDDQQVLVTKHDMFGQVVTFCLSCASPNTSWALSCNVRERLISRMQQMEDAGDQIFPEVAAADGA